MRLKRLQRRLWCKCQQGGESETANGIDKRLRKWRTFRPFACIKSGTIVGEEKANANGLVKDEKQDKQWQGMGRRNLKSFQDFVFKLHLLTEYIKSSHSPLESSAVLTQKSINNISLFYFARFGLMLRKSRSERKTAESGGEANLCRIFIRFSLSNPMMRKALSFLSFASANQMEILQVFSADRGEREGMVGSITRGCA